MKGNQLRPIKSLEVHTPKSISDLLAEMSQTAFQGRKLGEVVDVWERMIKDKDVTILMGYAGSLSVAGQWKIINWLITNHYVDVLVPTGANISEDIVEAMGMNYLRGDHRVDDKELLPTDLNRYYDVYGKESDYSKMTELIAEFIARLKRNHRYTTREFLYRFGNWLYQKGVHSIVAVAAKNEVPIYCPAIVDSSYGDALLLARSRGYDVIIDQARDYVEFMGLASKVKETGVIYIGGGVPKDLIQLLAVSPSLRFDNKKPAREGGAFHEESSEYYYPHKYAIQITTDSPQWGGLSGATLDEAISWGKVSHKGKFVQCFCDATIALPLVAHALAERVTPKRNPPKFYKLFTD